MWIIEHDGDVFKGKKLWLRPGRKFLFGRTGIESGGFAIANKTISRKHLTVEIGETTAEDAANPGIRSKLILEDLNTKIGTTVNGEQIRGSVRIFEAGEEFQVKLAHYEEMFRITWAPCVLSFSFTGKELKLRPLVPICKTVGPLDIKVDSNYRTDTTHVVASKRNTSKGLQALINGKYIVDQRFVDAIVEAAQSNDGESSALETDFEGNWPNPLDFLPAKAAEPTNRPDAAYAPTRDRSEIFDRYTFVFYSRPQFENLIAPITNGKGKALFREVDTETSVDEFVGYVKNVAGEKGLGSFDDGSEGRGTVVVRFIPAKGSTIGWFETFVREVSLRLDHRMIEQSEFLDAILNNDASVLRRPLEVESTAPPANIQQAARELRTNPISRSSLSPPAEPLTVQDAAPNEVPESSVKEAAPPVPARRQGRSRRVITSRFKGFDDFDLSAIAEPSQGLLLETSEAYQMEQSQSLFVSQTSDMEIDNDQPRSIMKRPASPIMEDLESEDMMEVIAPAAAKLKRRRLEEMATQLGLVEPSPPPVVTKLKIERTETVKRQKSELDILGHARKQRERAEEESRQEREALENSLDGMTMQDIRDLAIIEEMPLRSTPTPGAGTGKAGERWDEKWNGRKNFKKFRKRGDDGVDGARRNKVIVSLEEVKRKDFGIGDQYWLESSNILSSETQAWLSQRNGKGKAKESTQSSKITEVRSEHTNVETIASDSEAEGVEESAFMDLPDIPAIVSAPSGRLSRTSQGVEQLHSHSQHSKRPAEEALDGSAATKKAKTVTTSSLGITNKRDGKAPDKPVPEPVPKPSNTGRKARGRIMEDDDSDDGLGFKFGRRRR